MADIGALTVAVRLVADDLGSAVAQAQEELSQIADSANQIDGAMDKAGRSIEQSAGKQAAAIAVIAAAAIYRFPTGGSAQLTYKLSGLAGSGIAKRAGRDAGLF